jgi:triosephosphate isomerase
MRMLLAGNWKMYGLRGALAEIRALGRATADDPPPCDIVICPPATLIAEAVRAAEGTRLAIGGQDCHAAPAGAYTGDISAEMLHDAGATYVIAGHSERRLYHAEADAQIAQKLLAAQRAGLTAILCVGETEAQRDAGDASAVVAGQLAGSIPEGMPADSLVVAYEPVWAIGTGRTPTLEQIVAMHETVRSALEDRFGPDAEEMRILYGGSVKPDNVASILALAGVNGALVGGASHKASDFLAILRACPRR